MNLPIVGKTVDERFLNHRLRSTSLAGVIGGCTAICLFVYRYYVNHIWSRDLFAVAIITVTVKVAAMAWYHFTD